MNTVKVSRTSVERLILSLRMRQLQLLSTLADTGNMRATGQRLNMSTSAVSKSLREAEQLFGQTIFRRLPHGIVVTAAGDLIVQKARHMLLELSHLSDDLVSTRTSVRDHLVIGAPPFISWTWVPKLLRKIKDSGAETSIRLVEGRLAEMTRQFDAGDIDVLVTMDAPSEIDGLMPGGFIMEPLGYEEWMVVAAPSYHLRADIQLSWKQLHGEEWILPPRPTNSRMMVEAMMARQRLKAIVPKYETLNAITNVNLAEQGLGLTVLTSGVVNQRISEGRLRRIAVDEPFARTRIVLIYRHGDSGRAGVSAMRSAMQSVYKDAGSEARDIISELPSP